MEAFVGTILPWAANWAPVDWMLCNGQPLPTNQYAALYSLLGTAYGGNSTSFNLPNLMGRVPVGMGQLNGSTYSVGQTGGSSQVVLNAQQVPLFPHTHSVTSTATVSGGGSGTATVEIKIPVNTDNQPSPMPTPPTYVNTPGPTCVLAQAKAGTFAGNIYTTNPPTANANLKPFNAQANFSVTAPTVNVTSTCGQAGNAAAQPVYTLPPYQVINYIICVNGNYPMRN